LRQFALRVAAPFRGESSKVAAHQSFTAKTVFSRSSPIKAGKGKPRWAHDKNIRMLDFPPFFLASYRCTYILLP
jgi:hypothetical protein